VRDDERLYRLTGGCGGGGTPTLSVSGAMIFVGGRGEPARENLPHTKQATGEYSQNGMGGLRGKCPLA